MASKNFGLHYRNKKKLSSYQLSLLTPYIDLQPTVGSTEDKLFIKKSVKSVIIKQDSDVIVFNKIVALVLFVPDDVGFTSKITPKSDKFDFMDGTNQIFNLGSIWVLKCGWTGDKRSDRQIQKILSDRPFSDLTTYRTLLKSNISLTLNKYVGTLLFCRRSFLHFRDAVLPLDSIIQGKTNNSLNVILSLKDWLLDRGLLNQHNSVKRLNSLMLLSKKIYLLRIGKITDLQKLILDLKLEERSLTDTATGNLKLELILKKLLSKLKLLLSLSGKKYCTVRYLLTQIYELLFGDLYKDYTIFINGIGITLNMKRQKAHDKLKGFLPRLLVINLKYFIPAVILSLTLSSSRYSNQILHLQIGQNKGNTIYLKDYELNSNLTFAINSKGKYTFNDRADSLLDLYNFNKKVYLTNFLLRLSKINDYLILGFPKIKIYYLSPLTVKNISKLQGEVITVAWSFPLNNDQLIHLTYDRPNLLYRNFTILTPTNDQMLKINLFNVLQSTRLGQSLAMRGIIRSIKKVLVPGIVNSREKDRTPTDIHTIFKHRMYQLAVKRMNGGKLKLTNAERNDLLKQGKRIAGYLEILMSNELNSHATLYYFTGNLTYQSTLLFTKVRGLNTDLITQIKGHLNDNSQLDISGKLISYLRNRLNISVDIHGLFNVPVFRSYIVTHRFPGPILPINKTRWLNGKYIITSQLTKVDRTTIVTTLKGKRLPLIRGSKAFNDAVSEK